MLNHLKKNKHFSQIFVVWFNFCIFFIKYIKMLYEGYSETKVRIVVANPMASKNLKLACALTPGMSCSSNDAICIGIAALC